VTHDPEFRHRQEQVCDFDDYTYNIGAHKCAKPATNISRDPAGKPHYRCEEHKDKIFLPLRRAEETHA
jgi:hypothetical protein